MQELLLFLVQHGYGVTIKGKSWVSMIKLMEGMESTKRHFQVSHEVVFTTEMVKSVEINKENFALITLVN